MTVHIVGVRHHSPACARLVAHTVRSVRPRHVLIEGPADMNGRIAELSLAHELPIAVFSYHQLGDRTHASWCPFCRHSPEWIAMQTAIEVGATPRFMDLPAWHEAFSGVKNRYRDRADRAGDYMRLLCRRLGVDDTDTMWDHLFEQPAPIDELSARLDAYFEALRGDEPADERDEPRERFMAACLAWAEHDTREHGGDIVAVCGGYHAPALARAVAHAPPAPGPFPEPAAPPEDARHGSYLVPYSFKRLDSFVGYQSGLPSPAFYDALWESGPERAADEMLELTVKRLRSKRQPVSPADVIACSTMASALARLRGHAAMARTDLLDGIASALLKDALDVPLPWSYRGTILPKTDPLLVEVVSAFSGDRVGQLAKGTPRPPLLLDVNQLLTALDLQVGSDSRVVKLDLTRERDRERSRVLHRLRVLSIPGYRRDTGPAWATDAELEEAWHLSDPFERESALIEASAWGGTLESATLARLEDLLLAAESNVTLLAEILSEAVFVGITGLAMRVLTDVAAAVHREADLGNLGAAASRILALFRHDVLLGAQGAAQLAVVLEASFDRGLWLLEGIQGPTAPADDRMLNAIVTLRDILRFGEGKLPIVRERATSVMERRMSDVDAPPAIRGAAVGFLWSVGHYEAITDAEEQASSAIGRASIPGTLGDFLSGLFALAREQVLGSESLLRTVDASLLALGGDDFLIALPALRLSFTFFPPNERGTIASRILALHGQQGGAASQLLNVSVPVHETLRGMKLDEDVSRVLERFGL